MTQEDSEDDITTTIRTELLGILDILQSLWPLVVMVVYLGLIVFVTRLILVLG